MYTMRARPPGDRMRERRLGFVTGASAEDRRSCVGGIDPCSSGVCVAASGARTDFNPDGHAGHAGRDGRGAGFRWAHSYSHTHADARRFGTTGLRLRPCAHCDAYAYAYSYSHTHPHPYPGVRS